MRRETQRDCKPQETGMRDHYDDGRCPDCGEEISYYCEDGEECENCGHVFYFPESDTSYSDIYRDGRFD